MAIRYIESIVPLPENSGYAVTFNNTLEPGHVDAFGRVQGYHYRGSPPKLRFAIRFSQQDDPYTLKFVCDYCLDDQLMRSELLQLLKELKLVSSDTLKLTLSVGHYEPSADHPHDRV